MEISYTANNTFAQVHRDPEPYLFVRGPVGSGKSSGCIMHLFMNAMNQVPDAMGVRRTRYAVIRSTYPALKTTVVKTWKDWFRDQIRVVFDTPIRGTIEMQLVDGSRLEMEIYFIALDREDDVNKLQSLELTGAHINEAAEVTKAVFQMLKTRVKRYPSIRDGGPTKSVIALDYNSVDINHWLYIIAEEERPPKHTFYVQPPAVIWDGREYKENPEADNLHHYDEDGYLIRHLDETYYEDIVAGNDEDFINVYLLNNYGALRKGRPVYKAYEDKLHATDRILKPMEGIPLVIGMDCGLTPAAVFCQLSLTGQVVVLEELVTENTSIQEFAQDHLWPLIHTRYKKWPFEIIVDPAARTRSQNDKRSAMDILIQSGLPVRIAHTNNDLARREAVNYFLLKRNAFVLSTPRCPVLRKGFISEYKFAKIGQSEAFNIRHKEKPEKTLHSHVHDALQYAALEMSKGQLKKKATHRVQRHKGPASTSAGY